MSSMEEYPALSIGSFGDYDPNKRKWKEAINLLSRNLHEAAFEVKSDFVVNVIFHLGGKMATLDFEGTKIGRLSKKDSILSILVAVSDLGVEEKYEWLLENVAGAVDMAEQHLAKRKVRSSIPGVREVLAKVSEPHSE